MMTVRHRGAFTLVELLVSLAILGLLVMLFLPNFRGVLHKAWTVQCANNLREIHKAVGLCREDMSAHKEALKVAATWPSDIWPYIEPRQEVLICPEDVEPHRGYISYRDILRLQVRGKSWQAPFEEGPWMIRLSQTQWEDADLRERKRFDPPIYAPDSTPTVYWWGFEDWQVSRSDKDYEDVQVKFTELPDGRIRMDWIVGSSAFATDMLDKDNTTLCSYQQMRSGNPYYWGLVSGGGVTSYGMNVSVPQVEGGTGKLLALDYEQIVADSFADIWDEVPEFARHEGKINVVSVDGSVKLREPRKIDPAETSNQKAHWVP